MQIAPMDLGDYTFEPDLARAATIPARWYTGPEMLEAERHHIFGRSWQAAGLAAWASRPGAWFACEISGEPVLVTRAADGVLRAFSNVCRHRAAPLLTAPCGQVSKLRCRYHGWTYDLAGKLKGTPEFDGVQDFRKEANGLVEVPVATWGPMVWVHLERPLLPLEQFSEARKVVGLQGRPT